MEIKYTRKHNDSFMAIVGEVQEVDYEKKMIEANHISILLDYSIMQIDGATQYNYNISRKENVQDYLETRDYSLEAIEKIVLGLQIGLSDLEKYLIDENHILLEKETMFLEKINGAYRLGLCYYPQDNGTIQQQFRALIEHIISNIDGQDRSKAEHIYSIYDICLKEDYTLGQVIDYIQSNIEMDDEIEVKKIEFDRSTNFIEDDLEEYVDEPSENLYEVFERRQKEEKTSGNLLTSISERIKDFFDKDHESSLGKTLKFEDFVIEPDIEIEEKTVLLKDSKPAGKLVYDGKDGVEDDYIITKDIFRIGSAKNNDAILSSKAVSSNHAKIYRENDEYYLEDMNSLNGSFLHNNLLNYKQRVKLKTMDEIRFADVRFVFL